MDWLKHKSCSTRIILILKWPLINNIIQLAIIIIFVRIPLVNIPVVKKTKYNELIGATFLPSINGKYVFTGMIVHLSACL